MPISSGPERPNSCRWRDIGSASMDINAASPGTPADHGRVLLADDERLLRRVVRRGLAQAGFEVVEAHNGQAALELLNRERFDVVVSDVRMPVMDGIELLQALTRTQSDVPVVLISGSLDPQGKEEAHRLGAFEVLTKPFAITDLEQVVRRAAANSRSRAAPRKSKDSKHAAIG
jgi:DNA-binding NtrC family response regulator